VIDVEVPNGRALAAVLTLVRVAQHQVLARETNRRPRLAIVLVQVQHARDAQTAADDRQTIVRISYGQLTPEIEVVPISVFVERLSYTSIEEHEGSLARRDLNGLEVPVQNQNWRR